MICAVYTKKRSAATVQAIKLENDIRERLTNEVYSCAHGGASSSFVRSIASGIRTGYGLVLSAIVINARLRDSIAFFEIADMLASVEESHT
jgi:hypothetical protein